MVAPEPSGPPDLRPAPGPVSEPAEPSRGSKAALWALKRLGADPDAAPDPAKGRFPSTWQSFLWDLAPDQVAPSGDGTRLPAWVAQPWIEELAEENVPAALERQRDEAQRLQEGVMQTEVKASRLLTPFVALLTGAVALVAFQFSAIHNRDGFAAGLAWVGAAFGAVGSMLLLVGLMRALDSDVRMGRFNSATTKHVVLEPRRALRNEARAAQAARFVQQQKAERILFARAAISRSLVLLVVSAICASSSLLADGSPSESTDGPRKPAPATPTVTSTVTVGSTDIPTPTSSRLSVPTSSPTTGVTPSPTP